MERARLLRLPRVAAAARVGDSTGVRAFFARCTDPLLSVAAAAVCPAAAFRAGDGSAAARPADRFVARAAFSGARSEAETDAGRFLVAEG